MNIRDLISKLVPQWVLDKVNGSSERSKEAVRNIVLSLCTKCVTVVVSMMLIPLTISYVNPSQYGIWLTLSSVIGWVAFFDLGLGNGFRNRFAEAIAVDKRELAREYVSTTYFAVTTIISVALVALLIANRYVDWTAALKLEGCSTEELRGVFSVLSCFFCLSMIANNFATLLTADQKPGLAAAVNAGGQSLALLAIWILTRCTEGSLVNLALCLSGIPCLFTILVSLYAFGFSRYKEFAPSVSSVRVGLVGDILSLGISFFLIFICMLVVFQLMNVVLIRELGPDAVAQYNIASKYFNVLYSVALIILTPFWSAFTDAFAKKDFGWMKSVKRNLERVWVVSIVAGFVMLALSPVAYRILGTGKVDVPWSLSVAVMVYTFIQTIANIYMYLINGIGTVRLQLCIYVLMALVTWPLMVFGCRHFGTVGVLIAPGSAFFFQALMGNFQLKKLMGQTAHGIWNK